MRYKNLFIDMSNFYFRAYVVGSNIAVDNNIAKETTRILLKMISSIERAYLEDNGKVFFLFDNVHSGINKRKEIDPDYKVNRSKQEDIFYRTLDLVHTLLLNYKDNYIMVKKEGAEADDLVGPLTKKYKDETILLVSNDLDWFRSISDTVHVAKYEKAKYKIYEIQDFIEKYGFKPSVENLCIYKSFRGDSGDNIPKGVPGIRSKTLIQLINESSSLIEICRNVNSYDFVSDHFKQLIIENTPRLLINYKLVNYLDISIEEIVESEYACRFSPRVLQLMYSSLDLPVETIDPRVYAYFLKKKKNAKNFFQFDKIPRV